MKKQTRILMLGLLLALSVPAGFAVAGAVDVSPVNESNDSNNATHDDPDPSTDVREIRELVEKTDAKGDTEAYERAIEEMRVEIQSRMTPVERAAA